MSNSPREPTLRMATDSELRKFRSILADQRRERLADKRWGVVIWDDLTKTLIAGGDRLGEKPLLFTQVDGDWIFASEAKVLLIPKALGIESKGIPESAVV